VSVDYTCNEDQYYESKRKCYNMYKKLFFQTSSSTRIQLMDGVNET